MHAVVERSEAEVIARAVDLDAEDVAECAEMTAPEWHQVIAPNLSKPLLPDLTCKAFRHSRTRPLRVLRTLAGISAPMFAELIGKSEEQLEDLESIMMSNDVLGLMHATTVASILASDSLDSNYARAVWSARYSAEDLAEEPWTMERARAVIDRYMGDDLAGFKLI